MKSCQGRAGKRGAEENELESSGMGDSAGGVPFERCMVSATEGTDMAGIRALFGTCEEDVPKGAYAHSACWVENFPTFLDRPFGGSMSGVVVEKEGMSEASTDNATRIAGDFVLVAEWKGVGG